MEEHIEKHWIYADRSDAYKSPMANSDYLKTMTVTQVYIFFSPFFTSIFVKTSIGELFLG